MPDRVPLYDDFGDRYDLMVDWQGRLARESPFLEWVFRRVGARRVLDVGCATGWHAMHFARLGLDVTGVDPSAEMLRIAEANGAGAAGVRLVRAGLGQLGELVGGRFDVVTCLGNTLPHILAPDDLLGALRDVRETLMPGGALIVQQLNYDRILAQRQRFLGLSSAGSSEDEHLFFRFYDFGDRLLTFNVATFERTSGQWTFRVDSTTLRPITSRQLENALAGAGFAQLEFHGNYERQPFDPDRSNDLIAVAV